MKNQKSMKNPKFKVGDIISSKLSFHISIRPKWKILELRKNRKEETIFWCKSLHESRKATGFDNVYYEFNINQIEI